MQRKSKKRDVIYAVLCESKCHPTADEVFAMVKAKMPKISKATVYRNLAAFKNQGLSNIVSNENGKMRFDANIMEHDHFLCKKCGKVTDIPKIETGAAMANVEKTLGVCLESVTFNGICKSCLAKHNGDE